MKVVKQKESLCVLNHDYCSPIAPINKHNDLLGSISKRGLIVGSSGSGKTNAMMSLLLDPNGLRFQNVYLYSKTLNQPKYQFLKDLFSKLKGMEYFEYDDRDPIVAPDDVKPFSVIIFDDVVCCNQNIIRDYYCFGRHKSIDSFYLCQTYSSIPKQLIRDNANFLVIFKQDLTNLKHIYNGHVNTDMTFDQFQEICCECWKDQYGFLVIDKDSGMNDGRYRKGFDHFIRI